MRRPAEYFVVVARADLLLVDPHPFTATLHNFTATALSATIAHTTYISELRTPEATEWANRSSIWDSTSGRWQLRFHQGTPLPLGLQP